MPDVVSPTQGNPRGAPRSASSSTTTSSARAPRRSSFVCCSQSRTSPVFVFLSGRSPPRSHSSSPCSRPRSRDASRSGSATSWPRSSATRPGSTRTCTCSFDPYPALLGQLPRPGRRAHRPARAAEPADRLLPHLPRDSRRSSSPTSSCLRQRGRRRARLVLLAHLRTRMNEGLRNASAWLYRYELQTTAALFPADRLLPEPRSMPSVPSS